MLSFIHKNITLCVSEKVCAGNSWRTSCFCFLSLHSLQHIISWWCTLSMLIWVWGKHSCIPFKIKAASWCGGWLPGCGDEAQSIPELRLYHSRDGGTPPSHSLRSHLGSREEMGRLYSSFLLLFLCRSINDLLWLAALKQAGMFKSKAWLMGPG